MHNTNILIALALSAGIAACAKMGPSNELEQNVVYLPTSGEQRLKYTEPKSAPMAEDRKVNEQDCSKPIVADQGNLRCK